MFYDARLLDRFQGPLQRGVKEAPGQQADRDLASENSGHIAGKSKDVLATTFARIVIDHPLRALDRFDVRGPINLCQAEPAIHHRPRLRIAKADDLFELASQGNGIIECRGTVQEQPQTMRRALLIVEIREFARKRQGLSQCLVRVVICPPREELRYAKAALQDHSTTCAGGVADLRQRLVGPFARLRHQRRGSPEISGGGGEGHPQGGVAVVGESPGQRRAEIVDLDAIVLDVIDSGLKLPLGSERREKR